MTIEEEIRFIDLFGGVGGFRLGLERCNGYKDRRTQSQKEWKCEQGDVHSQGRSKKTHNNSKFGLEKANDISKTKKYEYEKENRGCGKKGRLEFKQTDGLGNNRFSKCVWYADIKRANNIIQQRKRWNTKISSEERKHSEHSERTNREPTTVFKCVWYADIDKYATAVYNHRFNEAYIPTDIRQVKTTDIPDFDMLCAGFPCQSFSIAGKRKGFQDTRGTLFFEICRIVRDKRPRFLFLENVKGLLSHDEGNTFRVILESLDELGYDLEWQVLNSKHFGVPQNRERVFIIGHLGGRGGRQVFPIGKGSQDDYGQRGNELQEPLNTIRGNQGQYSNQNFVVQKFNRFPIEGGKIMRTLLSRDYKDPKLVQVAQRDYKGGEQVVMTAPNKKKIDLADRPNRPFQLTEARTELGKESRKAIREAEGRDSTLRSKNHKKYVPDTSGLANCITTGKEAIEKWTFIDQRIRRLTPRECERLQGFPQLENYISLQIQNDSICIDLQKSYVNVVDRNPKLPRLVGSVGNEGLNESVSSVEKNLNIRSPKTKKPAQRNVLISCVGERVELLNQGKSYSFANIVKNQDSYIHHIQKEDFVQAVVGVNSIVERIIRCGKEVLLQNEQYSIQVRNGKVFVRLFGSEMMELAKDVKKDSTILKKHLRYIISNHSSTRGIEPKLITSFFYAISAIIGFIQKETEIGNSLSIDIYYNFGWTLVPYQNRMMSDSQRYKMMGNAVTVNVIEAIGKRMLEVMK